MTKTEQKALLGIVSRILYARRFGRPKAEETALRRLYVFCNKHGVDPSDAITQGTEYLRRNGIAANMNGIV